MEHQRRSAATSDQPGQARQVPGGGGRSIGAAAPRDGASIGSLAVTGVIAAAGRDGRPTRIRRSTSVIRRAPTLKAEGSDEYTDPSIPGATLKVVGAAGSDGSTTYVVLETGLEFVYDATGSGTYKVEGQVVDPAVLSPASTVGVPIQPKVAQGVTPAMAAPVVESEQRQLYDDAVKKSGGRLKATFEEWQVGYLKKVGKDRTKPIDMKSDDAIKQVWGGKARFGKFERAKAIMKLFTDAGYEVKNFKVSSRSSATANPPVLFDVVGHPEISGFEIHPGGGIHGAAYIRISASSGLVKVYNSKLPEEYSDEGQTRARMIDVSI